MRNNLINPERGLHPALLIVTEPTNQVSLADFIAADPEIQRLQEERDSLFRDRDQAIRDKRSAVIDAEKYFMAAQVLENSGQSYECSTEANDDFVRDLTGQYAQGIAEAMCQVSEEIRDMALACSSKAIEAREKREATQKKLDANWANRERVVKKCKANWQQLQAQQEEAVK